MPASNASSWKPTAFLVLAHDQEEHLYRLVRSLSAERCHCFVHLDSRMDSSRFESMVAGSPEVTILPPDRRRAIHWCGFSMVEATLELLREAAATGRFERFVLLSGKDYLIKDLRTVLVRIAEDREFIQVDRVLSPDGSSQFDRCANRCFLGDNAVAALRSGNAFLSRIARKLERRWRRRIPKGMTIYYGPSWWCLTREAVAEIFALVERRPRVLAWFRFARSPDEMFFQTAIKSTSRAPFIALDNTTASVFTGEPNRQALHYVDWARPNPALPRTLECDDFEAVRNSTALFARKFDAVRSARLLERIDRHLDASAPSD